MTLEQIRDWLQEHMPPGALIFVGRIDGNLEKCIGVYGAKSGARQQICIGGAEQTRYQEKKISLLIHWTKNPSEAEKTANQLYKLLYGQTRLDMGGVRVLWIDPGAAPFSAGFDRRGIAEYVMNATFYYERTEQNASIK
jgi:hypothetical protein